MRLCASLNYKVEMSRSQGLPLVVSKDIMCSSVVETS